MYKLPSGPPAPPSPEATTVNVGNRMGKRAGFPARGRSGYKSPGNKRHQLPGPDVMIKVAAPPHRRTHTQQRCKQVMLIMMAIAVFVAWVIYMLFTKANSRARPPLRSTPDNLVGLTAAAVKVPWASVFNIPVYPRHSGALTEL